MRTLKFFGIAVLSLGLLANLFATRADEADKPMHTIKEIMKIAHKQGLFKKVIDGNASDAEKKELADLYADLVKNTPQKGSPESWKEKTGAVAAASKDVVAGKPDSAVELKKANNCGACHKAHK
jgi:hypothetical protein